MGEKRGNIGKLKYDFDPASEMEIFLPNGNNWYRVTARAFRSFNGKRRLNKKEYQGPVYSYDTNKSITSTRYPNNKIIGIDSVESKKREFENF